MDIEKALELLDSDIRHEYKSKLSAIIKGFELISKYDPKSYFVSVQDQIWVGDFESTVELMMKMKKIRKDMGDGRYIIYYEWS